MRGHRKSLIGLHAQNGNRPAYTFKRCVGCAVESPRGLWTAQDQEQTGTRKASSKSDGTRMGGPGGGGGMGGACGSEVYVEVVLFVFL